MKEPPPTKKAGLTKKSNAPGKSIQGESSSPGDSDLTSNSDGNASPGSVKVKASSGVDGADQQSPQNNLPLPLSRRASLSDFGT